MMNTNETKKLTDSTDHSSSLDAFFMKKMEIDIINRKLKKHKKVSKKQLKKLLSFDFDKKEFRLIDKNQVAPVSVSRIEKRGAEQLMEKYKNLIQKSNQKILKKKYELLFEYQSIEDYESIYKNVVQPHESSNKIYGKSIEDYNNKKKEKLKEYDESRTRILEQQKLHEIELKSDVEHTISSKAENIKSYIEYQSELYDLYRNNRIQSDNIDEITMQRK